jgi:uncharacterized membrane protein YgaE (UPF0421/DUF939 family)
MITSHRTMALQLSFRAAVAAGAALALAQLLRLPFPLYAMISAILVTDLQPSQTRKLGLPRLAGTVLGATLGAVFCSVLGPSAWEVGIGVMAAMFLTHLIGLRDADKITGFICGLSLLNYGHGPWLYALYRTIETVIGIGVAILVSLVPKLIPTDKNRNK